MKCKIDWSMKYCDVELFLKLRCHFIILKFIFLICRMATPVYVLPSRLLSGLYADLHGGNYITDGYERFHTTLTNDGRRLEQVTYKFDFSSALVLDGRIRIDGVGGAFEG